MARRSLVAATLLTATWARAQVTVECGADGGVLRFETPQVVTLIIPKGCTSTFKAWGGGGGLGRFGTAMTGTTGGGGGFASVTRTWPVATSYRLSVGGGVGGTCPVSQPGAGSAGFEGGPGGAVAAGCAGGAGGGASVVWEGTSPTPLLVAAGGGGGGSRDGQNGRAGGVGRLGERSAGGAGFGSSEGGGVSVGGGGGGGAGFPLGGAGGEELGLAGNGGQSFAAVGGVTASGSGIAPGSWGDPDQPFSGSGKYGDGAHVSIGASAGAVILRLHPATEDATPEPLTFAPVAATPPGAEAMSETVSLQGFELPLVARVVGSTTARLSVNERAWVTEDVTSAGDTLRLRVVANDQPGSSQTVQLWLGTEAFPWSVRTALVVDGGPDAASPGPRPPLEVGCGCQGGSGAPTPLALLLLGALARVTRRGFALRRRRARGAPR